MNIELITGEAPQIKTDWLLVPVWQDAPLPRATSAVDKAIGGVLNRLRKAGDLTGKPGELTRLLHPPGVKARRVMAVGFGHVATATRGQLHRAWMTAVRDVCSRAGRGVTVVLPDQTVEFSLDQYVYVATEALQIGSVSQQIYRAEPDKFPLQSAAILGPAKADRDDLENFDYLIGNATIGGEAVNLTRELVNRHPGEVYPESFADRASQYAAGLGLSCDIFDERRLSRERMNAMLGVARGSDRPPRMVVIEYREGGSRPMLALVGKGVTFDSGGLSLKPTDSMKAMKCDMAGAASVLSAIGAIARLGLSVNVTAYMGLVENMPGPKAYKMGEVLTARNGVTIEVLNTDAEGRLVLADVLSYAVDQGAERIVDLATLTGSCMIALGEEVTGAFSNNQPWCDHVLAAAKRTGEDVWQMPMFDSFAEQLKTDVADCKNVGTRWGGAITAAKFLEKFVGETPWVHLDIAGPAWVECPKPHIDGGGTGAMVRTLISLAKREY